jgi:hypothetical protein
MSRIRTIKPEFFTSEDITRLTPMARLLYIAVWCEADREGRLKWKPQTFKLRYFPGDKCAIETLCGELTAARLIVLYGDDLAYIPSFCVHQHINPRESVSRLPEPTPCNSRVDDASSRVTDAQGGRERKGKEGEKDASPTGSRLPDDWRPTAEQLAWARAERQDINPEREADNFRDYWHAKPGKDGRKLDWGKTWCNWIRNSRGGGGARPNGNPPHTPLPELKL